MTETIELAGALTGELSLPLAKVVVNGVLPPLFSKEERAALIATKLVDGATGADAAIAAGKARSIRENVRPRASRGSRMRPRSRRRRRRTCRSCSRTRLVPRRSKNSRSASERGPMPYTYEYPHPSVTVDIAVFGSKNGALHVLLIERKHDPFAGSWALPGGFVDENEALDAARAPRALEETGLTGVKLTQVAAFGGSGARSARAHRERRVRDRGRPRRREDRSGRRRGEAEWHAWSRSRARRERVGPRQASVRSREGGSRRRARSSNGPDRKGPLLEADVERRHRVGRELRAQDSTFRDTVLAAKPVDPLA